ncbi:MAG: heme NO-binding domain-containing protein [Deltaproteobacteria bacterium]|nr:heme NO-binding domain-containing protein [Deltaproteobacteria bacterium]
MKGVIFKLLEHIVVAEHGEDAWDEVLSSSGLDGAYTSVGSYDHEDLHRLLGALQRCVSPPPAEPLRWFGRRALPLLAASHAEFFTGHTSLRSFLLSLNHTIHPEVQRFHPGAEVPAFTFDTSSDEVLVLRYRSARRLCAFGFGLLEGAAEHYHEAVRISEPECVLRGQPDCVFVVSAAGRQP